VGVTLDTTEFAGAFADAIGSTVLGNLAEDISTSLGELGVTITDALASTLSVTIEDTPVPVTVEGLEDALNDAFSNSGISAVGAEVADTRLQLERVDSIMDLEDGRTLEDRVAAQVTDLKDTLEPQIRTVVSDLDKLNQTLNAANITPSTNVLAIQGKAETALQIAQNALNVANRKSG
jgi:hypothetical protein